MGLRRPALLRLALVAAFAAVAVASTARTLPSTWRFLSDQHAAFADLTAAEPNVVPGYQSLLPLDVARFFRARLGRGDRYYLDVPPGSSTLRGVDYPTAVRIFGRFELLPGILVVDPRQADEILAVGGADPKRLGLAYARIDRLTGSGASVAWVDRG